MIYLLSLLLLVAEGAEMKGLIREGKIASLATMYSSMATKGENYPYTSLVPYIVDKEGRPIVFISDLAMHTKNLKRNSKCSLMVSKINEDDIFNSARVTLIGTMEKVPEKEIEEIKKIYFEKYPVSKDLLDMWDFSFYRMEVEHIHYIGGFGDINWYQKDQIKKIWEK